MSPALITSLAFFEHLSSELLHHIGILPGVGSRSFSSGVLWAGAFEHLVIVAWFVPAEAPFLLALVSVAGMSVSDEVRDAFLLSPFTLSRVVLVVPPFLIKRSFNSPQVLMELGDRFFSHVRVVPSSIMVKYLAHTTSFTSSMSIASS